jgi:hypothetical protein
MKRTWTTRLKSLIAANGAAIALTGGVAFACEPFGEPKPWSATGLAQFVAIASSSRTDTADVLARLVVGRNGAETLPPGPVRLVPWSFGADCKPLPWQPTRDGVWAAPDSAAFYTGRLRARGAWVDGMPTIDIVLRWLRMVWGRF